jgi:hypothetical protein
MRLSALTWVNTGSKNHRSAPLKPGILRNQTARGKPSFTQPVDDRPWGEHRQTAPADPALVGRLDRNSRSGRRA